MEPTEPQLTLIKKQVSMPPKRAQLASPKYRPEHHGRLDDAPLFLKSPKTIITAGQRQRKWFISSPALTEAKHRGPGTAPGPSSFSTRSQQAEQPQLIGDPSLDEEPQPRRELEETDATDHRPQRHGYQGITTGSTNHQLRRTAQK